MQLNFEIGNKVVGGKLAHDIKAHNGLHDMLVKIRYCASKVNIVPRVLDHDIMAENISQAVTSLARANQTSIIIKAISLLSAAECGPQAPAKATTFLL